MADLQIAAAPSLRAAFVVAARLLRGAQVETPELDARILLLEAAGLTPEVYAKESEARLERGTALRFAGFIERRMRREPVSRIIGRREFFGRSFGVGAATLDPRPDSEAVIEAALSLAPARDDLRILDLGTGSGCLLVSLLAELEGATGVGVDCSADALEVARGNAERLGVGPRARFVCGIWLAPIDGRFDLIVGNPPYVRTAEIGRLAPEVRDYEPTRALDGGGDGLAAYREIARGLPAALREGGVAVLEIGQGQQEAVLGLLAEAGLDETTVWPDLAGLPRCIAVKPTLRR
jgi:release factor glutamine methyltransferase